MTPAAARPFRFTLNGAVQELVLPGATRLLYVLRNDCAQNGPKFGCGLGQCGACAVLVDGAAMRSCITPLAAVEGRAVTTLDGLGSLDAPGPVQRAFIAEQAAQCGYCLNGMIIAAEALLRRNPEPDDQAIRAALKHHLCRCGTHVEIMRAVKRAAEDMAQAHEHV